MRTTKKSLHASSRKGGFRLPHGYDVVARRKRRKTTKKRVVKRRKRR